MDHRADHIRRGMPMRLGAKFLRAILLAAVVLAAPAGAWAQGFYYTVQRGDTVAAVARRHSVSPAALASANRMAASSGLVAGSRIWVPGGRKPAGTKSLTPANVTARPAGSTVARAPRIRTTPAAPNPWIMQRPTAPAPAPATSTSTGVYRVRAGDTLWRVARDYSLSIEELARMNGLSATAQLRVGQQLKVAGEPPPEVPGGGFEKPPPPVSSAPRPVKPAAAPAPAASGGDGLRPSSRGYIWPVEGRVVRRFVASADEKYPGIDVAVASGTEVRAANAGKVLYVGDTIPGYGTLVIIEHSGKLATVYGQLGRALVRENQSVSRGQAIARSGRTNRGEEVLHFEVRRDGVAINPEQYLP